MVVKFKKPHTLRLPTTLTTGPAEDIVEATLAIPADRTLLGKMNGDDRVDVFIPLHSEGITLELAIQVPSEHVEVVLK
jgi:hypothetical protein